MPINPNIPLQAQGVDTASPLARLNQYNQQEQMQAQQQQNLDRDFQMRQQAMQQQQANADRSFGLQQQQAEQQAALNALKMEMAKEDRRFQSIYRDLPLLQAHLQTGNLGAAKELLTGRLQKVLGDVNAGNATDADDTIGALAMLNGGDEGIAQLNEQVNALMGVGQMLGYLQPGKGNDPVKLGKGDRLVDPRTGEVIFGGAGAGGQEQPEPMPVGAVNTQNELIGDLSIADSVQNDLDVVINDLMNGQLDLSPLGNAINKGKNFIGASDEESRKFATLNATLQKMRNDSLRLNKGVQTEGDAQRAWQEIFDNMNDTRLVAQRLMEIQAINRRAADVKRFQIDTLRSNFQQPPFDYNQVPGGGALNVGERQQQQPQQQSQGAPQEGTTATNPQTGEKIVFRNGQWSRM